MNKNCRLILILGCLLFLNFSLLAQKKLLVQLSPDQERKLEVKELSNSIKRVSVNDLKVDSLLEKMEIKKFKKAYPSIVHFKHLDLLHLTGQ